MIFSPVNASEITGNKVPQSTANSRASRIQLLNRKALSREAKDSRRVSACRSGRRRHSSSVEPAMMRNR